MAHLLTGARKALLSPAVVASAPPPAGDPIADPVYAGHSGGAATGNVRTVTPTVNISAGKLLLPAIVTRSTATVTGVTDTAGNTYSLSAYKNHGQAGRLWLATCHNALALTTSDTVTFALDEASYCVAVLDYIDKAHLTAALDIDVGPLTQSTTAGPFSSPLNTGSFASSADEIVIEYFTCYDNPGTVTPTSGFTALTTAVQTGVTDDYRIFRHWKRQQSTTAFDLNPNWSGSAATQRTGLSGRAFKGA